MSDWIFLPIIVVFWYIMYRVIMWRWDSDDMYGRWLMTKKEDKPCDHGPCGTPENCSCERSIQIK